MNIIICYNNKSRELEYLTKIKNKLLTENIVSDVEIINGGNTLEVVKTAFKLKPSVILTYPLTGKDLWVKYHFIKLFFNSKIICLRTEGSIQKKNKHKILSHSGHSKYSVNLVHLELFWGQTHLSILSEELINQKKIASKDRMIVVGYPRVINDGFKTEEGANKIGIFTGFNKADVTRESLVKAKDNTDADIERTLAEKKIIIKIKKDFILKISQIAKLYPTLKFLIKPHPLENTDDYDELLKYSNIEIVPSSKNVNDVFKRLQLFIHFGSTTLLDSYLFKIKSINVIYKVNNKDYNITKKYEWVSDYECELKDLDQVIQIALKGKYLNSEIKKRILKSEWNYDENFIYDPINEISKVIISNNFDNLKIKIFDKYSFIAFTRAIKLFLIRFKI